MSLSRTSSPAIEVAGLRKRFGATWALQGVDLTVAPGTILGLLGPNGAGKTTIVRVLATLLVPDGGTARVAGLDVVRQATEMRARIGLAGQYAAVDELLSGRRNLEMVGRLYHLSREQSRRRAEALLDQFSLTDAADRLARTYSGGMRRRLDLAASLVARPPILFLDEPTTGLDPRARQEMWQAIRSLVRSGTTLLLTTQYLDEADQLADEIAVIDHGLVVANGTPRALKASAGGEQLDLILRDGADLPHAAALLERIAGRAPTVEEEVRAVSVACDGGPRTLTAIVRALDDAGIAAEDIAIRKPSLDDVFMRLTGAPASETTNGMDTARALVGMEAA